MHAAADQELLRRYAEHGAEEAFNELVQRHLNLVWAAARRVTGNADLAQDVAQTVFTDLARKASSLPRETVLAGWLYRAACHAAAKQVRGEARRAQREQHAIMLQHTLQQDEASDARSVVELQALLDAALADLPEADRDAVVLRYLAGRNLAEVGAALGTNADAAQKRVSRALEKLRAAFRQGGVPVGEVVVAAALDLAGTQMAPVGLAATVATGALAGAGSAAGTGAILLFMKSKLTLGIVGGAALIAALTWQQRNVTRLADENAALRQQAAALTTTVEAGARLADTEAKELVRLRGELAELLQLRGEVARLRRAASPATGNDTAAGRQAAESQAGRDEASVANDRAMPVALATSAKIGNWAKRLALAARIFATDHQERFPTNFDEMLKGTDVITDSTDPRSISTELFEFLPHERVIDERDSQMILLREKQARWMPNGKWERYYTLVDGAVRRIIRADEDFSEFELAGTATPANAPKRP